MTFHGLDRLPAFAVRNLHMPARGLHGTGMLDQHQKPGCLGCEKWDFSAKLKFSDGVDWKCLIFIEAFSIGIYGVCG